MLRKYIELPREIHILCVGSFVNRAGSFVMIFLTIYISEQLALGQTFAAKAMGAFGFGSIIASLVGGQLADQLGRKVVMVASLISGAAILLMLAAASSPLSVLLLIVLFGVVSESFRPACAAMLGDLTSEKQRPSAFSLYYIAINLGFACGPPLGGLLADYSFSLLFIADAVTMCLFSFVIILMIPESKPIIGEQDIAASIPAKIAIKRITNDRTFMLFCFASMLIAGVFTQAFSTLPIYIRDCGYSNKQFGLLMAINGLMIFVLQLPITSFFERFRIMSNMIVSGLLIAIGFGVYSLPVSTSVLVIAVLIWTTGEMVQAPFKHTVVTILAPPELRARYLGMIGMCFSISLMIGAPLGGEILQRFGPSALWQGCFATSVVAIMVYAIQYKAVEARAAEAQVPLETVTSD